MEKLKKIYSQQNINKIAEILFYIGITLELLYVIYDKSSFSVGSEGILFRISFVFFALKLMLSKYTWKEWFWIAGLGIIGFISYKCSSRNDMLRLVVMCAAFKDIDYKKVMKYAFFVMLSGCLLIFFLAAFGILGEMSMTAEFRMQVEETRYTLGFGHPNQMHCMFFVVATLGVFCFFEKVNWILLLVLMGANIGLYVLTDSRGGLVGMTCMVFTSLVLKYCKKIRDAKWPYVLVAACIVLVGIFSVGLAYFGLIYHKDYPSIWYQPWYPKFFIFDERFLSSRLWYCYGLLVTDMRNFRLFSQPSNVEYMDMGFYKLFYWYGYIPAAMLLIAYVLLVRYAYKKKEYAILMMIASFSAYTCLEAHFVSDYLGRNYLFFILGGVWCEMLAADKGQAFRWWQTLRMLRNRKNDMA